MEINDPLRYSIPYSAGIFNNRLQNRRLYCKKGEICPTARCAMAKQSALRRASRIFDCCGYYPHVGDRSGVRGGNERPVCDAGDAIRKPFSLPAAFCRQVVKNGAVKIFLPPLLLRSDRKPHPNLPPPYSAVSVPKIFRRGFRL